MWCPFLKEAEVRFCEVAPFRKMIVRTPRPSDHEHCSSPNFADCRLVVGRPEAALQRASCPFLHFSRMLYCNAMPVVRYVPYSDAVVSRCQGEAHHYCDTYLSLARPEPANGTSSVPEGDPGREQSAATSGGALSGAIANAGGPTNGNDATAQFPPSLPDCSSHLDPAFHFSPNHMWLDTRSDGTCVIGLDRFLVSLLGRIDAITFITSQGVRRPAVSLSVRGVDMHLVFPNRLELTGANLAVRDDPSRVVKDPYVRGWLFFGRETAPAAAATGGVAAGLRSGPEAVAWMDAENDLANRFAHEWLGRGLRNGAGARVMNDGGTLAGALAQHLDREDLMRLYNQFFELKGIGRES